MTVTLTNSVVDWLVLTEPNDPFVDTGGDGYWAAFPTEESAVEFTEKRWKGGAVYRRVTRWFSNSTSRETLERRPYDDPTWT